MSRHPSITEKIPRSITGLNGSLFVHIDFKPDGRVEEISFSEKGRDFSTLDKILTALGETTTAIIKDVQEQAGSVKR